MSLTILLIAVFLGLLILQVFLWAVFLRLGLRWAGAAGVTTRRIVVTTAVVVSAELVLNLLFDVTRRLLTHRRFSLASWRLPPPYWFHAR